MEYESLSGFFDYCEEIRLTEKELQNIIETFNLEIQTSFSEFD